MITNAQSVAATQNDPFYRSSLADHTRRQIRNLQLAQAADQSFGKGEPVIATQTPFPQNQDLPIITESPVESKSVNLDYSLHAHEAIHTPPSPLDIGAFTRAGAQRTTANPTLAPQQDISPISASDTTDSSAELVSPIVSNIWQLDQDRDLTNIGFALGLNTAPMSGQHQTSQGYGWNNNLEPSSAPHDRTTFRGDRQDSIGNRNFSYPGQSYPPPLPAISESSASGNVVHVLTNRYRLSTLYIVSSGSECRRDASQRLQQHRSCTLEPWTRWLCTEL